MSKRDSYLLLVLYGPFLLLGLALTLYFSLAAL